MRPQRCNVYLMSCFAPNMNQAVLNLIIYCIYYCIYCIYVWGCIYCIYYCIYVWGCIYCIYYCIYVWGCIYCVYCIYVLPILLFLFIVMQYDQCFLIRPYCIFDYQMLGDQIAATKLLRPIVVDPLSLQMIVSYKYFLYWNY